MFSPIDVKKQARVLSQELRKNGMSLSYSKCEDIAMRMSGQQTVATMIKHSTSKNIVLTSHELRLGSHNKRSN